MAIELRNKLLKGKVALVTGAAGGFGSGLVVEMARHGAHIVLLDLDISGLQIIAERCRAEGGEALPIAADLCNEESIAGLVGQVKDKFGRLDVIVNNAGVLRTRPIQEMTRDDWDATIGVNLRAPYVLCQSAVDLMEHGGGGSIVNVTSIATRAALINRSIYAITKGAIKSMTQQMAAEWGPRNIRCNSIFFGGISWSMKGSTALLPDPSQLNILPLRRLGNISEFANGVVFLSSDLSSYMTGAELVVDGGRTLMLLASQSLADTPKAAGTITS